MIYSRLYKMLLSLRFYGDITAILRAGQSPARRETTFRRSGQCAAAVFSASIAAATLATAPRYERDRLLSLSPGTEPAGFEPDRPAARRDGRSDPHGNRRPARDRSVSGKPARARPADARRSLHPSARFLSRRRDARQSRADERLAAPAL